MEDKKKVIYGLKIIGEVKILMIPVLIICTTI
jgi:hypothetical protein